MDSTVNGASDKECKMREQELGYLREELNQNLKFSNEYTQRLIGQIVLLWGGVLALFGVNNGLENIIMGESFSLYIVATIFFISIIVLYFFSLKNFEIAKSISEIAAYIAVFYEKRPNAEEDGKIFWELSCFEIAKENMRKSDENHNKKLNKEYLGLSIIAILINSAIFIKSLFSFDFSHEFLEIFKNINASNGLAILCLIYIVISGYLLFEIHEISFSDPKKWFDIKKCHLKSFLEYAIKTGHYTVDKAKERFGEDFYNEVCNNGRGMNLSKGGKNEQI